MQTGNRYQALIARHRAIELALLEEMKRPLPNAFVLQRLKRSKLSVRDEIQAWEWLLEGRPVGQVSATDLAPAPTAGERPGRHGP
ncbi:MAG: YdcH family protein [Minwuiales bacterium]|nr:YdcH family protein [Minwuiales bacterium]